VDKLSQLSKHYNISSDNNIKIVVNVDVYFSLEMLDKVEPPQIPIGYGISIAYACLLDIIRSIALTINGSKDNNGESQIYQPSEFERKLHVQLINSSWCGLLAALSPLIDAR